MMHIVQEMAQHLQSADGGGRLDVTPYGDCNDCLSIVTSDRPASLLAKLILSIQDRSDLTAEQEAEVIRKLCEIFAFDGMKTDARADGSVVYFPEIPFESESSRATQRLEGN